jgi:hypothetical protein
MQFMGRAGCCGFPIKKGEKDGPRNEREDDPGMPESNEDVGTGFRGVPKV